MRKIQLLTRDGDKRLELYIYLERNNNPFTHDKYVIIRFPIVTKFWRIYDGYCFQMRFDRNWFSYVDNSDGIPF